VGTIQKKSHVRIFLERKLEGKKLEEKEKKEGENVEGGSWSARTGTSRVCALPGHSAFARPSKKGSGNEKSG
jgi:hypothetical protein